MKRPVHRLSREHVQALYALALRKPWHAACVSLLWRAGLRNEEACSVRGADLLLQANGSALIHVREGKGKKSRHVALDRAAAVHVFARCDGPEAFVLRTRTGEKVQTSTPRRVVRELAARLGIPYRVYPHALRHRYAVDLLAKGVSVREIQLMLGHASLETTQIYLDVDRSEALANISALEWD